MNKKQCSWVIPNAVKQAHFKLSVQVKNSRHCSYSKTAELIHDISISLVTNLCQLGSKK